MARKTQRQRKQPKTKMKGRPRKEQWFRSDEEEIALREARAESEKLRAERLESLPGGFGQWRVWRSDDANAIRYEVEIRSRDKRLNSCSCPDFAKNGLGFCKHVAFALRKSGRRKRGDSSRPELFLAPTPEGALAPQLMVANDGMRFLLGAVCDVFVDAEWQLLRRDPEAVRVLVSRLRNDPQCRDEIWISPLVERWLDEQSRHERLRRLREEMATELREAAGKAAFLKFPLYDYQISGMLHLAFTGRALLADEMGLGKTVQAIAAAQVLHDVQGIRRVLVISPASLKAEWDDQIAKFTDLPTVIVYGNRKERLHLYRTTDAFFVLANYEQIMRDYQEINELLQPDLVILDEAQRIKNWKTKTARNLKRLEAPYAFVLTGTPLENRIDDLYSLVEFVDPNLLGSLFRFNRQFYADDGSGKAAGMANLAALHRTVATVMLRRRKDEIREQLPERIDNNYFVPMSNEQRNRYDEYETMAARLLSQAARRPLLPKEHERLQLALACMRMLCDTCFILDNKIRESPKVRELATILAELWADEPDRKILIFSEWVRMLELVADRLDDEGVAYALHTGNVPQKKRREEIRRFKEDVDCRVLLSTESGGSGLNLQVASVVINLDLPWNPAKLEQRIARVWRKHQRSTVQVINLVSEETIEQRMLGTLAFKQDLADAVLDGRGDVDDLEKPQSRQRFLERLQAVMNRGGVGNRGKEALPEDASAPTVSPDKKFAEELNVAAPSGLEFCGLRKDGAVALAVAEDAGRVRDELAAAAARAYGDGGAAEPPECVVITPEQRALLARLAELGVIEMRLDAMTVLRDSADEAARTRDEQARRQAAAQPLVERARRALKMGTLLLANEFVEESGKPLREAAELALHARAVMTGLASAEEAPDSPQLLAAAEEAFGKGTPQLATVSALLSGTTAPSSEIIDLVTALLPQP